jgi:hypothetical protein
MRGNRYDRGAPPFPRTGGVLYTPAERVIDADGPEQASGICRVGRLTSPFTPGRNNVNSQAVKDVEAW